MRNERELLKKIWEDLDGDRDNYNLLCEEIEELLIQPEQEPVAWTYEYGDEDRKFFKFTEPDLKNMCSSVCNVTPLYASPPKDEPPMTQREMYQRGYAAAERDLKREPLSDGEICLIYDTTEHSVAFARAIEKEHGIEEMTYPDFMVTSNAENKVTLTLFNSGSPTASLFMNSAGTAFLIEELAFQIKDDYLIEITKLREDTMSKERELLKRHCNWKLSAEEHLKLLRETEALLAQPEQEPVAWKVVDKTTGEFMFSRVNPMKRTYIYDDVIPLYTLPQKREPMSDIKCPYPEETSCEYRDGFTDGILYAEKMHGIGVDDE